MPFLRACVGRGFGSRYPPVAAPSVSRPRRCRDGPPLDPLVVTVVHILERFDDGPQIREAVDAYSRYHLIGLNSYFES